MDEISRFSGCTLSYHQCRCFEKLTPEQQEYLNAHSVKIKYRRGEMICKQDGFVSHVMYMEKGLAKVFLENGSNALVLRIIPDGNFLGLAAVSKAHTNFPYSAMAYVDSEIRQIDVTAFRELMRQNNDFVTEIIDILSANSIQIYGRFFCLTYKQAFGRLADILLCLADRIFKQNEFDLPLSRKELAELSGMSPETVIRMLKEFNEEGVIRMEGKYIEVLDPDRLRQISETG
ncbi:MAG: Crp/Fnr family transcriptional regulator [Bacteroidales bacterium]